MVQRIARTGKPGSPPQEFMALWAEGEPFAEDPPNADFTCTVAGAVVNQATLMDPVLDEATGTLTYAAALVASAGMVIPSPRSPAMEARTFLSMMT